MPASSSFNSTIVRLHAEVALARARVRLAAVVAPERAIAEAARRFMTPPTVVPRPRDREFLSAGDGFVVESGGVRHAAWRFGAAGAPAIVLSHGWGGRSAQFRAFVAAIADAGWQAVVFDHAGHGYSEGRQASLMHFARSLAAVVEAVEAQGIAVAAVVGHSLGAAAIPLFLRTSGRELPAVLVAPPSSLRRYSSWFARHMGLPEPLREGMQAMLERRIGMAWEELELPQGVASLRSRALVIHDEGDRTVPFAAGLAVARAWPDARFLRTRGLGHTSLLRDEGVIRDALDFLLGEVAFPLPPSPGEGSAFRGPAPLF